MISVKNIILKKGGKTILDDVSCEIVKSRITALIGKSGAGKTSLLRCIANLNDDYEGQITLEGKDVKTFSHQERVKHIGFVSQHFDLFPHMTALQNCVQPMMNVLKLSQEAAEKKATQVLDSLHILECKDAYLARLSGGQKQRVAIARALCLEPECLLFDEPTSALDPQTTKSLQGLLKDLCSNGITIVVCSHDMPFVKGILDRVYFLENGVVADFFDAKQSELKTDSKIYDFLMHG